MSPTSYTYRPTLTRREKEVLACLADSLNAEQIAGQLSISEQTVATHVRKMLLKTGTGNTAELVRFSLKGY